MVDYINHVTLNSGHTIRQRRADIDNEAIAAVSEVLDGILQGAHLPVPGFPDYLINGSHHEHDLIATIWRAPWEKRAPIVTMATALRSRSSPALWRLMHHKPTARLETDANTPPSAPWQADRVEIGAELFPDALAWTGDFSRCLAWAWSEYRK